MGSQIVGAHKMWGIAKFLELMFGIFKMFRYSNLWGLEYFMEALNF